MNDQEILTPVGRVVQGHCFIRQDKDLVGNPLVDKSGDPRSEIFVRIAIRKDSPEWANFHAKLLGYAMAYFPSCFDPNTGKSLIPKFGFKILDGDTDVNEKGRPYSEVEGFAGHHVIKLTTGMNVSCFIKREEQGSCVMERLTDENSIKRGDYIRAAIYVKGNAGSKAPLPGIYLNVTKIQLCGIGEEIRYKEDLEIFAQNDNFVLPTGASVIAPAVATAVYVPPTPTPLVQPTVPVGNTPPYTAPVVPIVPIVPIVPVTPIPAFLNPTTVTGDN